MMLLRHALVFGVIGFILTACAPMQVTLPINNLPITRVWQHQLPSGTQGQFLRLGLALSHGVLYVPSATGQITALDAQTGKIRWQVNTRYPITTGLTLGDGRLYVGTNSGDLLALSARNGELMWSTVLASDVLARPILANHVLYAQASDQSIYAFNPVSGHLLWDQRYSEPLTMTLRLGASPCYATGMLYVGLPSGYLLQLNAKNGQLCWQHAVGPVYADLACDQNHVWSVSSPGNFRQVSRAGRLQATLPVTSTTGLIEAKPFIFVSQRGVLWAIHQGHVAWHSTRLSRLSPPNVMGNFVVVGTALGQVLFFNQVDGRFEAMINAVRGAIDARPLVVGNHVYVVSSGGDVESIAVGF